MGTVRLVIVLIVIMGVVGILTANYLFVCEIEEKGTVTEVDYKDDPLKTCIIETESGTKYSMNGVDCAQNLLGKMLIKRCGFYSFEDVDR
jgi:hypothetical protein